MTVVDGDLLRVVQHATLPPAVPVSTKYYLQASLVQPVLDSEAIDAIEAWLETAYDELEDTLAGDCEMGDAVVDIISWQTGAWRTGRNLGTAQPIVNFASPVPVQHDAIAGLLVYSTRQPRTRRPLYQWGIKWSAIVGNHLNATNLARLVSFGVDTLSAVDLPPYGSLIPVLAHALRSGTELLTGFVATDLVTATHRRSPTA